MAIDVMLILADIERGTRFKIADEMEHRLGVRRTEESVRRALKYLYSELLLERAGRANRPPAQKSGYGPTIWKLHSRLRYAA